MEDSLGSEYGTEVGSSTGMSDGNVERNFEDYSGESMKVVSVVIFVASALPITTGVGVVTVAAVAERFYDTRRW